MDDRKRQIEDLEKKKRDNTALLDGLLIRLGEGLFERVPDSSGETESDPAELKTYRRLQNDIAGSETAIELIEEQIQKLKELEENITAGEKDDKACAKELSGMYGNLGRVLLDSPADGTASGGVGDFCAPYRSRADALLTKAESLDDRLSGLERKEGGNVFTWIGNSAQSLVLKSFLTKARENLESLRRTVGERYSREHEGVSGSETVSWGNMSAEVGDICGGIEKKRAEAKALARSLADLREEKRQLNDSFGSEGSPAKQIQTLKKHIAGVRDELKALYQRVGAAAAGIAASADAEGSDCGSFAESLASPEDRDTLEKAAEIGRSIQSDEKAIARLRASLAIDEEEAKIEKFHKMILDKKEKIAQAEKNIADYEEGIADCEKYIEKLRELL
jgi:chromosome segregation ATPase